MTVPQDVLDGQVVIGEDNSLQWYDGQWYSQAPLPAFGVSPSDLVEAQLAIGGDNGFYWYSNGSWFGGPGVECDGNPPQDAIQGQIALGDDGIFCWNKDDVWYTFGSGIEASPAYVGHIMFSALDTTLDYSTYPSPGGSYPLIGEFLVVQEPTGLFTQKGDFSTLTNLGITDHIPFGWLVRWVASTYPPIGRGPGSIIPINDNTWHTVSFRWDYIDRFLWTGLLSSQYVHRWSTSMQIDGVDVFKLEEAWFAESVMRFDHLQYFSLFPDNYYIDNLNIVTDGGSYTSNFDTSFGPFIPGSWLLTHFAGRDCIFGPTPGTVTMDDYLVSALKINMGSVTSVQVQCDVYLPTV